MGHIATGWEHDALRSAFGTSWAELMNTIEETGEWSQWKHLEPALAEFIISRDETDRPRITPANGNSGFSDLIPPLVRLASVTHHNQASAATVLCFLRVNKIRRLARATSFEVSHVDALTTAWMIFRDCANLVTAQAWEARFGWELRSRLSADFRQYLDDTRVVSSLKEDQDYIESLMMIEPVYAEFADEAEELHHTLQEAVEMSIITGQQRELLLCLVDAAHSKQTCATRAQAGSEIAVCAEKFGIKPRAMRYRRENAISALQQHAPVLAA